MEFDSVSPRLLNIKPYVLNMPTYKQVFEHQKLVRCTSNQYLSVYGSKLKAELVLWTHILIPTSVWCAEILKSFDLFATCALKMAYWTRLYVFLSQNNVGSDQMLARGHSYQMTEHFHLPLSVSGRCTAISWVILANRSQVPCYRMTILNLFLHTGPTH